MSELYCLAGETDNVKEAYRLLGEERLTTRELARRLDVEYHSANDWVGFLFSAGLVERSERESGRRGPNPYEYFR